MGTFSLKIKRCCEKSHFGNTVGGQGATGSTSHAHVRAGSLGQGPCVRLWHRPSKRRPRPMVEPLGALVDPLGAMVEPLGQMVEQLGAMVAPLGQMVEQLGALVEPLGPMVEPQVPMVEPLCQMVEPLCP